MRRVTIANHCIRKLPILNDWWRCAILDSLVTINKALSQFDSRIQELQSGFDQLLRPYAEVSGVTEDDIDDELRGAQKRMTALRKKRRLRSKALPQKINDFQQLVKLRDLLRTPPATRTEEVLESECDDVSRPHTEVTGASDESKLLYSSAVGTYGAVDTGTDIEVIKCCCCCTVM